MLQSLYFPVALLLVGQYDHVLLFQRVVQLVQLSLESLNTPLGLVKPFLPLLTLLLNKLGTVLTILPQLPVSHLLLLLIGSPGMAIDTLCQLLPEQELFLPVLADEVVQVLLDARYDALPVLLLVVQVLLDARLLLPHVLH